MRLTRKRILRNISYWYLWKKWTDLGWKQTKKQRWYDHLTSHLEELPCKTESNYKYAGNPLCLVWTWILVYQGSPGSCLLLQHSYKQHSLSLSKYSKLDNQWSSAHHVYSLKEDFIASGHLIFIKVPCSWFVWKLLYYSPFFSPQNTTELFQNTLRVSGRAVIWIQIIWLELYTFYLSTLLCNWTSSVLLQNAELGQMGRNS